MEKGDDEALTAFTGAAATIDTAVISPVVASSSPTETVLPSRGKVRDIEQQERGRRLNERQLVG